MTTTTIREAVSQLYSDDTIADYHVHPDHIRCDLHDGGWVAVGPDLDPEQPENDPNANGYIWTAYASDDTPIDTGGDDDISTLAAAIRALA